MKKNGLYFIACILLVMSVTLLSGCYAFRMPGLPMQTLNNYFDKFDAESESDYLIFQLGYFLDGGELTEDKLSKALYRIDRDSYEVRDYYAIIDDTLYFLASNSDTDDAGRNCKLYIGKMSKETGTAEYDYLGEFGDETSGNYKDSIYTSGFVCAFSDIEDIAFTSIYSDGYVYVKDTLRTVRYNIDDGTVEECSLEQQQEVNEAFGFRYKINRHDKTVTDSSTGLSRGYSYQDLLQNNQVAKVIEEELSSRTTWSGSSYMELADGIGMYEVGGELYAVYNIFNYHGEIIPVIYKYDLETNGYYFVNRGFNSEEADKLFFVKKGR